MLTSMTLDPDVEVREDEERSHARTRGPVSQFGMGLDEETMARLDRLRACLGWPRGRVAEAALRGQGLGHMERKSSAAIQRFDSLAARQGFSWKAFAALYAETYSRRTWPPDIEALEAIEKRLKGEREQLLMTSEGQVEPLITFFEFIRQEEERERREKLIRASSGRAVEEGGIGDGLTAAERFPVPYRAGYDAEYPEGWKAKSAATPAVERGEPDGRAEPAPAARKAGGRGRARGGAGAAASEVQPHD